MHESKEPEDCIEWKRSAAPTTAYWSVAEYDSAVRRGRAMASSRERGWSSLLWTECAPMVEALTVKGVWTVLGTFRIFDWDVYDRQMRELIGIA